VTFLWGKRQLFSAVGRGRAGGGDAGECFLGRDQRFFGARGLKKGQDPSLSRTSRRNTNITHFPFATGQRGGNNTHMHCTR